MSIEQNIKIIASDVTTILDNKQDKLSYTPVKSVNGTAADEAGNVTINIYNGVVTRKVHTTLQSGSSSDSGGTYTISGLTALKPVYIEASTYQYDYVSGSMSISSGLVRGGISSLKGNILLACIPTGTTLTIRYFGGVNLTVYQ